MCSVPPQYQFGGSQRFVPANGSPRLTNQTGSGMRHVPVSGGEIFVPVLLPTAMPQRCTPAWTAAGCLCGHECNSVGASHRGSFASEFGCVSMSSAESMSSTLSERYYSVHGAPEVWAQRNCEPHTHTHTVPSALWSCDTVLNSLTSWLLARRPL